MRARKSFEPLLAVIVGFAILVVSAGVSWCAYVDNGDGTVNDTATGLTWQQADDGLTRTWQNSLSYCEALNLAGRTDWRLPDIRELKSIVDYSRYNPTINPSFSCRSLLYWSGSTYAYVPGLAWGVYFNSGEASNDVKNVVHYVRCVCGGPSGALGYSNFSFSTIASPRSVNTPFSVRIAREDGFGNTVTTFNGEISLSCSVPISPISVNLVNGVWNGNIELHEGGANITITANSHGVSGSSNNFSTASIAAGNIGGTVKDNRRNIIQNAIVHISDRVFGTDLYPPIATDENGIYEFVNIPAGNYYVWADYQGKSSIRLPYVVSGNRTSFLPVLIVPLFSSTQMPVVLVPGIMGSTQKDESGWVTPRLKSSYMKLAEMELFEKFDPLQWSWLPGWKHLKEYLRENKGLDEETTIVDCPWDWRMPLEDAYKEYLINAIDIAKAGNPNQKINIVAHSMGGLLVRKYIQSEEYASRNDIESFTMVGTPNKGSANAFYIWEGGEALKVDNITSNSPLNIYFNTIEALYEKTYKMGRLPHYGVESHAKIRKLVQEKVSSLRQLMPTYGFLQHEMGEPDTISTEDNINNFLLGLNSDSHRFDRMGLPSSTDKVKTRVYYCGSKDTIKNIDVKPTTISNEFPYDFYEDGQPRKDPKLSKMGDGTVPDHSAKLPCDDIVVWAECPSRDADHTSLIAKYHRDIADDLYADVEQNVAQARGSMAISQANDIFNRLMISVNGRVQPHIVDPQGMSVGISPISGTIDTAPATTLKIEPDSGFIAIDNPIDGNYVLSLKSLYSEDCRISIAFTTDSGEYVVAYAIFFYPGVFSISFNLSSGSQAPIVISHQPEAPGGLMADAVEQDGLKTTLSWNPSDDPLVTGYRIYARYIDDPFLKLIGSSASTSYFTGESWASNSSIKKRLYAVTGMRPDGSESFLSDTVTNDDRDHDGLSDVIETSMGTFVDDPDSDGDKWTDGDEVLLGADPLDPESSPCFGDSEPDGDVDGSDLFEFIVGIQNSNIEKFALSFGRTGCQ